MSIEITVRDTETGSTDTRTIDDDYLIITAGRYYLSGIQRYANGTAVLTVKAQS